MAGLLVVTVGDSPAGGFPRLMAIADQIFQSMSLCEWLNTAARLPRRTWAMSRT